MRAVFVISLLIAVVSAGNWNNNDKNHRNFEERDGKHQKFVIELLRHLQQDIHKKDFMQYSYTIRLDNKNDYKDLNKVYYLVSLFQNGWFEERNKPFSLMRERNIVTTKALFDFFDTMNDWNTCAMNLIWARRNINEYQFWHLMNLLVVHNRHFTNIVLPAGYEVFPNHFFTADVIDQAMNLGLIYNKYNSNDNNLVIMSNYTTGVLGSNDDDDNRNVYDLNDIKNENNKINDWNTLKKVMNDINNQMKFNNYRKIDGQNKDIKNKIWNNNRNLNQGNKFDNNGEDRMVYFTEDIGLNNYYYFSRIANSRIVDNKQMYNNLNNKENFNMKNGKLFNNMETYGKVNRRGERYLYQMKQLLARFNLERKSNGLDSVQDITLDGTIDNGVYPNLRYTNGLQMPNRQNEYTLKKQHNMRLIQVTKDFENRFYRAIDQGFVQTQDGHKVDLQNNNGINILGNLLQGNRDSVNVQYYRYLEYYYRLLFGGNNNDHVDFTDKRFVPTVLDHYETSMRDSVFWQMIKRITNIVNKFQNKLSGYKTQDVDFNGVKINNVKVDKLVTRFNYFDSDLTNGINMNMNYDFMCNKNNQNNNQNENFNDGSSSESNSDSSSSEEGNQFNGKNNMRYNNNYGNNFNNGKYFNNGQNFYNGRRFNDGQNFNDGKNFNGQNFNGQNFNNGKNFFNGKDTRNNYQNNGNGNNGNFNSDSDSNESNSGEVNTMHYGNKNMNNDRFNNFNTQNGNDKNFNTHGTSQQVDYYNRNGNYNGNMNVWKNNIVGRTRRLDTKQFTVSIDVQSNKNQRGIVRIFLGTRINNKQQLNDNRNQFVEIDQFIVKLNQGQNLIKRSSYDFKNVVGDPQSMRSIYFRTLNFLNKKTNGDNLNNLNFDTNNNNRGFPHRLVLPKGTVGGEDYTLFVIVSDLDSHNNARVQYTNNMNTGNNFNGYNNDDSNESDSRSNFNTNNNFNSNSDSDSSDSDSNEMNNNMYQSKMNFNKNRNDFNNYRYGNNFNRDGNNQNNKIWNQNGNNQAWNQHGNNQDWNQHGNNQNNKDWNQNGNTGFNGNYGNSNGVMIHNNNDGNKNVGNGNGVLDNRAMGFPLDRQILDFNGFITKNMFFKDVKIFHDDNNNNNNNNNNKY